MRNTYIITVTGLFDIISLIKIKFIDVYCFLGHGSMIYEVILLILLHNSVELQLVG